MEEAERVPLSGKVNCRLDQLFDIDSYTVLICLEVAG